MSVYTTHAAETGSKLPKGLGTRLCLLRGTHDVPTLSCGSKPRQKSMADNQSCGVEALILADSGQQQDTRGPPEAPAEHDTVVLLGPPQIGRPPVAGRRQQNGKSCGTSPSTSRRLCWIQRAAQEAHRRSCNPSFSC